MTAYILVESGEDLPVRNVNSLEERPDYCLCRDSVGISLLHTRSGPSGWLFVSIKDLVFIYSSEVRRPKEPTTWDVAIRGKLAAGHTVVAGDDLDELLKILIALN